MADTPKATASLNNGQQTLASSSCGMLMFILENEDDILANSAILCSNIPVLRKMALECGFTGTFDVHDSSKDAVKCFLDACHSGVVKLVPLSIFRDVYKTAHANKLYKLMTRCLEYFESMVDSVEENNFPIQMYLFEEAMFEIIEMERSNLFKVIKRIFTFKTSHMENFVTNYLADITCCSAENLDAILDLTDKQEHILVKVLINSIRLDSSSFHANTRCILEKLDFTNYPITHNPSYNTLLELLETIENPSKEDYRLIMYIFRQSVRRNDAIMNNQHNHIAFPNLFLDFKQNLRYSSTLDEILMFLMESPHVSNSYIFFDAMETWIVNNRRKCLPDSTIDLFIAILREQISSKKWQPLANEYIIPKCSLISGALEMKILQCTDLTTNTEYFRLPSISKYTSEQLFSADHDINLAGQIKDSSFFLQVKAASNIEDNSFDVKLVTDLMALRNDDFNSAQNIFYQKPVLIGNNHFTLDIEKQDGTCVKNVAVGWYDKPHRDGTGQFWCWGPHCFFNEGVGQPLAAYRDTKLHFWGSHAKIRPVVYLNVIYLY